MAEKKEGVRAVVIEKFGGPEVFKYVEDYPDPSCGDDDVVIHVVYGTLNFIDVYQRTGLYPIPLPAVLGRDGSGVVEKVGKNVKHVKAGDRVAWVLSSGYASRVSVPGIRVVKIPDSLSFKQAAAAMLQGLTTHYLVVDSYHVKKGDTVLVHAGAGGVGQLLIQAAKALGATVITTVSSEEKAAIVKKVGADHVIMYTKEDVANGVRAFTKGEGVHAVYDGVGKTTFQGSLQSLRRRGTLVSFGNASGVVAPFDILLLSKYGSLTLVRPKLDDYLATRDELQGRVDQVFQWVASGALTVGVHAVVPLKDVADAHRMLEGREALGKILILADETNAEK